MKIVETDRLFIRKLEEEDIDALMSVWGDKDVMKYCGGALFRVEVIINNSPQPLLFGVEVGG